MTEKKKKPDTSGSFTPIVTFTNRKPKTTKDPDHAADS